MIFIVTCIYTYIPKSCKYIHMHVCASQYSSSSISICSILKPYLKIKFKIIKVNHVKFQQNISNKEQTQKQAR